MNAKKFVLAISGSLRAGSSNSSILLAMAGLAPEALKVELYNGLGNLPHYRPEQDGDHSPDSVREFRELLKVADGVLICTPEYAFGIPGVLKNALDWTVSSGELNEKPVAAISASPLYTGGEKALASLRLTLSALGAEDGGHLSIPSLHKVFNGNKEIADPETLQSLSRLLASFMRSMDEKAKPGL